MSKQEQSQGFNEYRNNLGRSAGMDYSLLDRRAERDLDVDADRIVDTRNGEFICHL